MKIIANQYKTFSILMALVLTLGAGIGVIHAAGFDRSFAIEYSYSCLGGGCHETNTQLVAEYARSSMTHAMVKCNTCHGTHTAAEVGKPKPNLTGYVSGMGATGYIVGSDRCETCHAGQNTAKDIKHPNNAGGKECVECHFPHEFLPRNANAPLFPASP